MSTRIDGRGRRLLRVIPILSVLVVLAACGVNREAESSQPTTSWQASTVPDALPTATRNPLPSQTSTRSYSVPLSTGIGYTANLKIIVGDSTIYLGDPGKIYAAMKINEFSAVLDNTTAGRRAIPAYSNIPYNQINVLWSLPVGWSQHAGNVFNRRPAFVGFSFFNYCNNAAHPCTAFPYGQTTLGLTAARSDGISPMMAFTDLGRTDEIRGVTVDRFQLPEALAGEARALFMTPPDLIVIDLKLARDQVVLCRYGPSGASADVTAIIDGKTGRSLTFEDAHAREGSACHYETARPGSPA